MCVCVYACCLCVQRQSKTATEEEGMTFTKTHENHLRSQRQSHSHSCWHRRNPLDMPCNRATVFVHRSHPRKQPPQSTRTSREHSRHQQEQAGTKFRIIWYLNNLVWRLCRSWVVAISAFCCSCSKMAMEVAHKARQAAAVTAM